MAQKPKTDNTPMKRLEQELRSACLGKLYVLHGEETYLREHYLTRLKAALVPEGLEDFNLHTIPGKECTLRQLAEAVDCLPMMSERTLVLVTDFDLFGGGADRREGLAALFADLPDYCCLVFYYDLLPYKPDERTKLAAALKQHGSVVPFPRQEGRELVNWIARRFRALEHDIAPREAEYLIAQCGELMQNLITEIDKIAAFAGAKQITRADIDAVVIPQVSAVVWNMTDAIARGSFDSAAGVMSDLLGAQESPIMILSVVGQYFRQLYAARLILDRRGSTAELAKRFALPDWKARQLMTAARRYSLPWCRTAVRRCAQTDLSMKSWAGEERELLVSLLVELPNTGGAAS